MRKSVMQERGLWEDLTETGLIVPQIPKPSGTPLDYAISLSQWYSEIYSAEYRKKMGQFFTPAKVAAFMAGLSSCNFRRVLDPGAGTGILSCAVVQRAIELRTNQPIRIVAYEPDAKLAALLERSLKYASKILREGDGILYFEIRTKSFVQDVLEKCLNLDYHLEDDFANYDLVIANPPYFKISSKDVLVKYAKDRLEGTTNIYTLMMGLSAKLLNQEGEMVFIIPRSFTSGAYFSRFRRQLFRDVNLNHIHVFESRKEAFKKDKVLQENIIVKFSKKPPQAGVEISYSTGSEDIVKLKQRTMPLDEIYDVQNSEQVINIPLNDLDDAIVDLVKSWDGGLHKYGMEISTGPVVSHRSLGWIAERPHPGASCFPLLWMQHVMPMVVVWPKANINKQQYVIECKDAERWLVPDNNYVLLRRFSAKEEPRRLTAAPLFKGALGFDKLGLENHLNFIHRPGGKIGQDEARGLAAVLNSKILDTYFRVFSGNTQVSATDLRSMPLPSHDTIKRIGSRIKADKAPRNQRETDIVVCEELRVPSAILKKVLEEVNGENRRSSTAA